MKRKVSLCVAGGLVVCDLVSGSVGGGQLHMWGPCLGIWYPAAPALHRTPGSGLCDPGLWYRVSSVPIASLWPGQGLSVAKVVGDKERGLLIGPFCL